MKITKTQLDEINNIVRRLALSPVAFTMTSELNKLDEILQQIDEQNEDKDDD